MIRYALFDLDETLYPPECGVLPAVGRRIEQYLIERLGLPVAEARRLRVEYRDRYGTTLAGLLAHHNASAALAEDYLLYVHDVPVERLVSADPELDGVLAGLPWEPMIFTNSDWRHSERVLGALGIRQRFSRIFDITGTGYRQKPHPEVYRQVLETLGVEGSACLFVDDGLRNLTAAKAWGMTTVWVGQEATPVEGIDFCIPRIAAIREVVAKIEAHERQMPDRDDTQLATDC